MQEGLHMNRIYAGAAILSVAALLGGSLLWVSLKDADDSFAACRGSAVAGDIGGPFTLVDETGATVTDKDVLTKPSLIYFGYTFCPDVCPYDNARNAEAVALLEERGLEVQPVFISVDPARDTPEVLADFTDNLHPRMIGLSGSPEQVKAASQAYKTYYKIQDPEQEFYLIDHSTFTYFVMPEVGFVDFFKRDETPEQMAQRVQCFMDAAAASGKN